MALRERESGRGRGRERERGRGREREEERGRRERREGGRERGGERVHLYFRPIKQFEFERDATE